MNHRDSKFQVSYVMRDFTNNSVYEFLNRIEQFIDSSSIVNLSQLELSFSALRDMSAVSGGALSEQMKQELSTKRSFILIKNTGNECFWWSMVLLLNYGHDTFKKLSDQRYPKQLKKRALELCTACGANHEEKVRLDQIDGIVNTIRNKNQIKFDLVILDGDALPHFGCTGDISRSIKHRTYNNADIYFYILFDEGHFSPILDIKQFLNVRAFCPKCMCTFHHLEGFEKHDCQRCVEITDRTPKKISLVELKRDTSPLSRTTS